MTDTFTWKVEVDGTSGQGEFVGNETKFGDGYSQASASGLNSERQKWSVSRSGFSWELADVLAFVRSHQFVAFLWKAPLSTTVGHWRAKSYSLQPAGADYWKLSIEFEQTYGDVEAIPVPIGYILDMTDDPITDMMNSPIGVM